MDHTGRCGAGRLGGRACRDSDGLDTAGAAFPEDVLDAVVPLLHPDQAEPEVDDQVADHVEGVVSVADLYLDHLPRRPGAESRVDQSLAELTGRRLTGPAPSIRRRESLHNIGDHEGALAQDPGRHSHPCVLD